MKEENKLAENFQLSLFRQFISNNDDTVSNAVELWENIPKYFFTPAQVAKLRLDSGHADPYEQPYLYKGIDCTVTIHPALIKQSDGQYKAFFPSVTEELIEEALKKILTRQGFGSHHSTKSETWVKFSLRMVSLELKKRGKTRDFTQIKKSIQIMSQCIIVLSKGKKEIWKGAILQDLVTVDRERYIEDTASLHAARLPLFISNAIDKLEYRQYNIDRHMSLKTQLSRWLYKRFVHRYKQASLTNEYHFKYSTIKEESRFLEAGTERNNRIKVIKSLNELKESGILMSFISEDQKEGRAVVDVVYTVNASIAFRGEQKASNAAASKRLNKTALPLGKSR